MLVPAMTFAWWLVSMSTAPRHEAVSDESAPTAEAVTATQQQDTEDDTAPAEPAGESSGSDETDDTTGQRVPVKTVTTAIVRAAKTFLDLPMGAERSASIDGRRYVFVLERHYHPPGFVGGPHGFHKGVTVYELR
jgi:hypothetical protein